MERSLLVAHNDNQFGGILGGKRLQELWLDWLPAVSPRRKEDQLGMQALDGKAGLIELGLVDPALLQAVPFIATEAIDVPIVGIEATLPEHSIRVIKNRRRAVDTLTSIGTALTRITMNVRVRLLRTRDIQTMTLTKPTD